MLGISRASSTREYQLLQTNVVTSTGSVGYSIPSGVLYLEIECWGPGGGGASRATVGTGRSASQYAGAGGGGGSYIKKTYYGFANMQAGDVINVTVGAGGTAGADGGNRGMKGGETSIDNHKRSGITLVEFTNVNARGGGGGQIGTPFDTTANGGAGGIASNGDINTNGTAGDDVTGSANLQDGSDGGAAADPGGGAGGVGAIRNPGGPAGAGNVPGGGGGGGSSSNQTAYRIGKDGADGKIIIKAYG